MTGAGSTRVLQVSSGQFPDDWRVAQRLTINWGLRWEYFGPPQNFRPNIDSIFYFGLPVTSFTTASNNPYMPVDNPSYASLVTGGFQMRNNEIWNKGTDNFGPRPGFAYDLLLPGVRSSGPL